MIMNSSNANEEENHSSGHSFKCISVRQLVSW